MYYGKHSFLVGAWRYCARCDEKWHIDEQTWQRGLLLCPHCVDKRLLGQREVEIARVLGDGKMELAPVPKLREPDTTTLDEGDIII
jgi:hypothetical protein